MRNTLATGLGSGHIPARRASTSSSMAIGMTLQDSGCRVFPVRHPQGLSDCGSISNVGWGRWLVVIQNSEISEHSYLQGHSSRTAKGMTGGDSAHQLGPICDPLGHSNCSGGLYQRSGIPLPHSEISKYSWLQRDNQQSEGETDGMRTFNAFSGARKPFSGAV